MIDPSRNRVELLAEIEAAEPRGEPLSDLTDSRVATTDAHVRAQGKAKKDLFSLIKLAISDRFAVVQRIQLNRYLIITLRNGLGHVFNNRNARNPATTCSV